MNNNFCQLVNSLDDRMPTDGGSGGRGRTPTDGGSGGRRRTPTDGGSGGR
jgi:hypothetical protein